MRRIRDLVLARKTYVSLGYVLLRIPFGIVYASIFGVVLARGPFDLWTLLVLVPVEAGVAGGSGRGAAL